MLETEQWWHSLTLVNKWVLPLPIFFKVSQVFCNVNENIEYLCLLDQISEFAFNCLYFPSFSSLDKMVVSNLEIA